MWDVFHPSQPMPSGFRLRVSYNLRRVQNCSDWNCLIRPTGLARTCSGRRKSVALLLPSLSVNALVLDIIQILTRLLLLANEVVER